MFSEEAAKELAKAGGQIAETTDKALDASAEVGRYLTGGVATHIPRAIVSILGGDWIIQKYVENLIIIQRKLHNKAAEKGLSLNPDELPWRIKLDVVRAISEEDDTDLQEYWANLLANAMRNDPKRINLNRYLIDVLRSIPASSVRLLDAVFSYEENNNDFSYIRAESLIQSKLLNIDPVNFDILIMQGCLRRAPYDMRVAGLSGSGGASKNLLEEALVITPLGKALQAAVAEPVR